MGKLYVVSEVTYNEYADEPTKAEALHVASTYEKAIEYIKYEFSWKFWPSEPIGYEAATTLVELQKIDERGITWYIIDEVRGLDEMGP
jgi:hypothetical protein